MGYICKIDADIRHSAGSARSASRCCRNHRKRWADLRARHSRNQAREEDSTDESSNESHIFEMNDEIAENVGLKTRLKDLPGGFVESLFQRVISNECQVSRRSTWTLMRERKTKTNEGEETTEGKGKRKGWRQGYADTYYLLRVACGTYGNRKHAQLLIISTIVAFISLQPTHQQIYHIAKGGGYHCIYLSSELT